VWRGGKKGDQSRAISGALLTPAGDLLTDAPIDGEWSELTDDDIARIAGTYHAWRGEVGAREYADVPGFCKSATIEEIRERSVVLSDGSELPADLIVYATFRAQYRKHADAPEASQETSGPGD